MKPRITQSVFLEKSTSVHGDKFDYGDAIYTDSKTKVNIKCPEHGVFYQSPSDHWRGRGCSKCKGGLIRDKLSKGKLGFIDEARKIHKNKYSYESAKYVNSSKKVVITCDIHGNFKQSPKNHIEGKGCPECGNLSTKEKLAKNIDNFIKEAVKIHGEKYSYEESNYENNLTKIDIICKKHGKFSQLPSHHLRGCGCPECSNSKMENFISRYLEKNKIRYVGQKTFEKCVYRGKLRYDFYLPSYNLCIEYNGEQHYLKNSFYHKDEESFISLQERDLIKTQYCVDNDINLLIVSYKDQLHITEIMQDCLEAISNNTIGNFFVHLFK